MHLAVASLMELSMFGQIAFLGEPSSTNFAREGFGWILAKLLIDWSK